MNKPGEETSDMAFTEADWESAADEARAAGHRVERTSRGYEVYPHGEEVVGGPSMIFPTDGEDPAGGIRDLKRMAQMKRNPTETENPRQRFRTGCSSECIRSPGHGGECRRFPDRFYDKDGNLSEDVSQDELLAARAAALSNRKKHMQENPPRFREGDRVVFDANPAALMMYTPGTYPPVGTWGSVTTVPVPGRGRSTNMPGPRGGLVYVKWDDWGVVGVFAHDLSRKLPKGIKAGERESIVPPGPWNKNPDYDAPENDPENYGSPSGTDLVEIDDSDLVKRLFDWHSGQGDPVYAVASSSNAGRKVTRALVDDAIANLSNFLRKVKGKDKKDLEQVIEDLLPYGT